VGDAAAWSARMEKGIDAVVTNAVNGLNAMPAKGMCFTCTNDDIKALVQYMVDNSK
jgi:cytochrome c5